MNILRTFGHIACLALVFPFFAIGTRSIAQSTPFLGRGVNDGNANIPEKQFADFAATGGNLFRLQLAKVPLREMNPPYAFNEQNFAVLEHDLDMCQKYKLNCIVDPHVFPGMEDIFTTHARDQLWSDSKFGELAVQEWSVIAERLAKRGSEVAAYDLVNEPALPPGARKGSAADWNGLAKRMIAAIRAKDANRPIIIEAPIIAENGRQLMSRNDAFKSYLTAPPEANVIYSVHMYDPKSLAQGKESKVEYPGEIDGEKWNAETIARHFAPVVAFQEKYHVQIYLGEFGCVRWQGESGNRYLKDIIDFAEAHHWSWTYHDWRGADWWDAEKSDKRDDEQRHPSTPRLTMLESYWKLGDKQ